MALLDEGSTITIEDSSVAKAIGLTGQVFSLCLKWAENVSRYDEKSMNTKFEISGNNQHFHTIATRTIDKLNLTGQKIDLMKIAENVSVEERLPLILIGQDNCHLVTPREIIQPSPTAPMMSRTTLGWVAHGPISVAERRQDDNTVNLCSERASLIGARAYKHLKH
jgi:hypothetical protein